MSQILLGNLSPIEESNKAPLDIKQAMRQPAVTTPPTLTPALTPEETFVDEVDAMAGKKLFSLERPDDRARQLAASLTLEEQVGVTHFSILGSLVPTPQSTRSRVLTHPYVSLCVLLQQVSFWRFLSSPSTTRSKTRQNISKLHKRILYPHFASG